MEITEALMNSCYSDYSKKLAGNQKMFDYYKGKTDALENYKMVTERSNLKTRVNFIKKFIKEEVSYTLGNKITYTSKSSNTKITDAVEYNLTHWSEKHDQKLLKNSLIFGEAYELCYINKLGEFCARIYNPLNCYVLSDEFGDVQLALHVFKNKFDDTTTYIDVYLTDKILHYKGSIAATSLIGSDAHYFGEVPVSICAISEDLELDTLFHDLKGLQDAYETNLSDITNEISDFRSAYLVVTGVKIDDTDLPKMKELGAIQVPNKDGSVSWLIKNINDSFIQNTLNTLESKIYQISGHINANEKLSSNTSSLALRTRLISLENVCSLDEKAVTDSNKNRLRLLFIFLKTMQSLVYDYKDVKQVYTYNIPSDDLVTAQIIAQLGDKLSTETGLAQLSFVDNVANEMAKRAKEQKANSIGNDLLNPPIVTDPLAVTK
ncbi:phage portal protein [Clostridium estertheticum]|uniref:phage portal protein n=1 Tax=Clostridium estertheticum TaxID=238834 RepID=UPI001C0CD5F9|nr:phage portal protein [Clostridium estertheticum]MBU3176081.1 phage portal protein [Clostridium estertheticum]